MRKAVFVGLLVAVASPAFAGVMSITNGGFDSNMTGWGYGNAGWGNNPIALVSRNPTTDVWPPGYSPQGGNAAGISYGGEFQGNHWIYQEVTGLTVGVQYTVGASIAGGQGGAQSMGGSGWYQFGYVPGAYSAATLDSGAGCVNVIAQTIDGVGAFPWTSGSANFTATQSTYTIYYKYGATGTNWNYYAPYIDGVTFTPEPVTMLLLGIPALFLRRRHA